MAFPEAMMYTNYAAQMGDNQMFGYGFPARDLPSPEDCANLLQTHSALMQQLEIENKYLRVRGKTSMLCVKQCADF